jgi:hypothetical protein
MFPNHYRIKLEIVNRRKFGEDPEVWTLSNILLNNKKFKEENFKTN